MENRQTHSARRLLWRPPPYRIPRVGLLFCLLLFSSSLFFPAHMVTAHGRMRHRRLQPFLGGGRLPVVCAESALRLVEIQQEQHLVAQTLASGPAFRLLAPWQPGRIVTLLQPPLKTRWLSIF